MYLIQSALMDVLISMIPEKRGAHKLRLIIALTLPENYFLTWQRKLENEHGILTGLNVRSQSTGQLKRLESVQQVTEDEEVTMEKG